jgi:hypothetical protein
VSSSSSWWAGLDGAFSAIGGASSGGSSGSSSLWWLLSSGPSHQPSPSWAWWLAVRPPPFSPTPSRTHHPRIPLAAAHTRLRTARPPLHTHAHPHPPLPPPPRPCQAGEVAQGDICRSCLSPLRDMYTFDPKNASCDVCPPGATCWGSYITPAEGMWHSHPRSTVFHNCLLPGSCAYGDRAEKLKVGRASGPGLALGAGGGGGGGGAGGAEEGEVPRGTAACCMCLQQLPPGEAAGPAPGTWRHALGSRAAAAALLPLLAAPMPRAERAACPRLPLPLRPSPPPAAPPAASTRACWSSTRSCSAAPATPARRAATAARALAASGGAGRARLPQALAACP